MNKDKGVSLNMFVTLILFAVIIGVFGTLSILNAQITGAQTSGPVSVNVGQTISVNLVAGYTSINFGTELTGADDTTEDRAADDASAINPFLLRNDGNIAADVTAQANVVLFTGTSPQYRIRVGEPDGDTYASPNPYGEVVSAVPAVDTCDPTACYLVGAGTQETYASIPIVPAAAIQILNELEWNNAYDEARADIHIYVPIDEIQGAKGPSTITFTASSD